MTGKQLVITAVLAVVWPCTVYKLFDLIRNPRARPLRALALTLVTISTALTMQLFVQPIDRWVGVVDSTRVTSNCVVLVSATAAQAFLLYMTGVTRANVRSVRIRVAACAAAVTAIGMTFARTPPRAHVDDPAVVAGGYYTGGHTYDAGWVYVYVTLLLVASVEVGRLAWRYAGIADRPLLRLGLRTMTVAAGFSILYCILRLAYLMEPLLHVDLPGDVHWSTYVYSLCILLFLIGATIPSWGPRVGLAALLHRAALAASVRRLRPLWQALRATDPALVLAPERALDLRLRHTRMVTEICDFVRAIRPLADPGTVAAAHRHADAARLTGTAADAAVEAAVVAVALHRHADLAGRARTAAAAAGLTGDAVDAVVQSAVRAHVARAAVVDPAAAGRPPAVGTGQVHFLEQVAAAFRSSPVVPAVVSTVTAPAVTSGAAR